MERFKMDQPVLLDRKRREKGRKEGGGGKCIGKGGGDGSFSYCFRVPTRFLAIVDQELFAVEGCFSVQH